jgi:membrane associated rhomboid family serine protease
MAYTIGPGAPTPAVKTLLIVTIGLFIAQYVAEFIPFGEYGNVNGAVIWYFGMTPAHVFRGYLWQPLSYMFLHGGFMHLIFNMLAVWMFGVDLERRWGKTAFYRYYFVCGVGAALTTLFVSLLPLASTRAIYVIPTIGASGSVYGLLLAYAMFFPNRIIYYFIFPIPVRIYVLLAGLLVLYESARGGAGGGVAHFAHLGGLIFGYLYLSMGRGGPWAEIKYRYVKWRMNRLKKRFDVHEGGRRWDSRVH